MSDELNKIGQKRFKYKKGKMHFSWNDKVEGEEETTVKVTFEFITQNDKSETHTYNRTVAQVEAFFMPLVRIVLGIDSISNALLYVNDTYAKGIYLRIIEQGTEFMEVSGIKVDANGKWRLE